MLTGNKCFLVPINQTHIPKVMEWYYDHEYIRFFRAFSHPMTADAFLQYSAIKSGILFIVILKENQEAVGIVSLFDDKHAARVVKAGAMIDKTCQHKGIAMDAVVTAAEFVFNTANCRKLVFTCCADDERSCELMKKGGLRKEATLQAEAVIDGKYIDEVRFTMFKETFATLYGGYHGR